MSVVPISILLVEDDAGHAHLIQRNLERSGCVNPIVHVTDGEQALDFVHCQGAWAGRTVDGPLLLLLDIKMPRMDGLETLRQLKSQAPTESIPIIMLTTTDDPREVDACYRLGCNAYITKPVVYEAFADAVSRLGMFLQIVSVPPERTP